MNHCSILCVLCLLVCEQISDATDAHNIYIRVLSKMPTFDVEMRRLSILLWITAGDPVLFLLALHKEAAQCIYDTLRPSCFVFVRRGVCWYPLGV